MVNNPKSGTAITTGDECRTSVYWPPRTAPGYGRHREYGASPPSERPVSTAPATRMADHQERDVTVRGTRVRMQAAGSGDPLLYLHGSGDLGLWMPALTELAKTHRVYRPDHPGFSGSDDRDSIDSVHDLAF